MGSAIAEQKRAARKRALAARDAIAPEERATRGAAACARLFRTIEKWHAERDAAPGEAEVPTPRPANRPFRVALFDSMDGEVPTKPLVDAAFEAGWEVCFPVLVETAESATAPATRDQSRPRAPMAFVSVTAATIEIASELFLGHPLRRVSLRRLAGHGVNQVPPTDIDAIVVPLVAFDADGNRLGYGGGYYDHVLSALAAQPEVARPFISGLAFAEQQLPSVPTEPHDLPLPHITVA